MRALAQSLAREFGPKGVHVAHAIIDGVIDIERTKEWKFDHPDAKISPHAVRRGPQANRGDCLRGACRLTSHSRLRTRTGTFTRNRELASRTSWTSDHISRSGRFRRRTDPRVSKRRVSESTKSFSQYYCSSTWIGRAVVQKLWSPSLSSLVLTSGIPMMHAGELLHMSAQAMVVPAVLVAM